jgi:short-subunit dehydrogenase
MKKIIITGASSGIGEALAVEYANKGFSLGLIARRLDRLEALKAKLKASNVPIAIRSLDVSDDLEILPTFESISEELGGLDLVIANAGITAVNRTGKDDFENDRKVIQINLISAMATIDAAVRIFRSSKTKGQIVGISSVSAFRGIPGSAAYSGSKAGFSNYLSAVRMELRNKGIEVTTVHPGFVATDLSENMEKYPFVITSEKAAKAIVKGIDKKKANIIVPKVPWSILSRVMAVMPDSVVSRAF